MLKKIIDFKASWCSPCKYFAPIFKETSEMEEFKDIEFISYDVDEENEVSKKLISENRISGIPTVLLLDENDKLINKIVGALPKEQFVTFIRNNNKNE